jgi:hypothetical protein
MPIAMSTDEFRKRNNSCVAARLAISRGEAVWHCSRDAGSGRYAPLSDLSHFADPRHRSTARSMLS